MSTFPTIVGHRGARGEAPENTAAGFQVAMEAGVTEIELDVRLSRDGHLIVVHDANVTRTTGERGKAHHYTLSQLEVLDARRNTPGWHSPLGIPSLREVVDLCGPSMRFQFEVKGADRAILHRLAHQLVDFINQSGLQPRGENLYAESGSSGPPQTSTPGLNGVGTLIQGALEGSNVNVVEELVNMIETQRAYEMSSKAIAATDQMLQYANNNV